MTASENRLEMRMWVWAFVSVVAGVILVSGCVRTSMPAVVPHLSVPPVSPAPRPAHPAISSPAPPAPALRPAHPAISSPRQVKIRTRLLGHSETGRGLYATYFGSGPHPALVFGGIHGNEPTASVVASRLVAYLRRDPDLRCLGPLVVMQKANPDGLAADTRANARGVDLNRNFPARNWKRNRPGRYYGGPAPASESETQALVGLIEKIRPRLIITIHAISGRRQCNNYDGPGRDVARLMTRYNGYPTKATIGYPTPGSLGSWAGSDLRIPVVTLELPARLAGPMCWRQNRDALLAAIRQSDRDAGDLAGASASSSNQAPAGK